MNYPEPPDITREPKRANIERILAYLGQLEAVPGDVLDAVEGERAAHESGQVYDIGEVGAGSRGLEFAKERVRLLEFALGDQ